MADTGFKFQDRIGDARSTVRDKLRATATPAGIWRIVRTLLWLAPLTILVWYTAESSSRETVPVEKVIKLVASDRNKSISPSDGKISFTAYVTRPQVDQVKGLGEPLVLTLTNLPESGPTVQRTRDLLVASDALRAINVSSVTAVSPENLQIVVDTIVEKDIAVVAKDIPNLVRESAVFDPPTVKIRGPADALRNGGTVEAALDEQDVFATPGKKDKRAVKLRWTGKGDVQITPATVDATVEIRESDVEYVVASVPVFATLPVGFTDDWKLSLNPDFITNVKLLGPEEQITLIRDAKYIPKARLDFVETEFNTLKGGSSVSKRPVFDLPDRVRVDGLDRMMIECKATKRSLE